METACTRLYVAGRPARSHMTHSECECVCVSEGVKHEQVGGNGI